jgi:phosphopantothenoylcysteine decarboxylase/phosphopantothenate--cysteine ligase
MQQALNDHFDDSDILIMSAAVADARPAQVSKSKIKKDGLQIIELELNPDLLS